MERCLLSFCHLSLVSLCVKKRAGTPKATSRSLKGIEPEPQRRWASSSFFHLKDRDDGKVVADASLVDGAKVGAMGFDVSVSGVRFCEEG